MSGAFFCEFVTFVYMIWRCGFFVDTWKNEFPCLRLIPGVWFLRPLISCVEPLGRVSMGLTSHFIDLWISPVNGFFYPFFWFRVSRYIEFLGPERYSDKVVHFITLWSLSVLRFFYFGFGFKRKLNLGIFYWTNKWVVYWVSGTVHKLFWTLWQTEKCLRLPDL